MQTTLHVIPNNVMHLAVYPPGATFGPRHMRDYEFVWMVEGDAEYRWADQTVPAPQGSVVLCRPGNVDFFTWDTRRRTRHAYIHFNITRLPRDWPKPADWPLVRMPDAADILRPMFQYLLNLDRSADACLLELTLAHMLAVYVTGRMSAGTFTRAHFTPPVEDALAFIHTKLENDPAAPISLADLAAASHVTAEHLCRLFARETGCTPLQTVRLARLDRAAVLLARSNYSIARIAALCGFASPFHFSRLFKTHFGQSPRTLRHALDNGQTPPLPRIKRLWTKP